MRGEKNGKSIFRKRGKQTETQKSFKANPLSKILAAEKMKGAQILHFRPAKTVENCGNLRECFLILMWASLEKILLDAESVKKSICFIQMCSLIAAWNRH